MNAHSQIAVMVLAALCCAGCGESASEDTTIAQMVYVDTTTGTPLVAETATQFPAVNPSTGKRTLMPGLYCAKCEKWYAAPPVEEVNRQKRGAVCRKCGEPLTLDGPKPGSTTEEAAP